MFTLSNSGGDILMMESDAPSDLSSGWGVEYGEVSATSELVPSAFGVSDSDVLNFSSGGNPSLAAFGITSVYGDEESSPFDDASPSMETSGDESIAFDFLENILGDGKASVIPMAQSLDSSDSIGSDGVSSASASPNSLVVSSAPFGGAIKKKYKAACTNCRDAHVACSHELPCTRCIKQNIASTCRYLPRKPRTNYAAKKRKSGPSNDAAAGSAATAVLVTSDGSFSAAASNPIPHTRAGESHGQSASLPAIKWTASASPGMPGSPSSSETRLRDIIAALRNQNQKLEGMLQSALTDIKSLQQQKGYEMRMEHMQLVNLDDKFSIPPMSPAVAVVALCGVKQGLVVQCNEIFRHMLGYTWKDIKAGIGCIHLFPERLIPGLMATATAVIEKRQTHAEGTLIFIHKSGFELAPVQAKYQFTYNADGSPFYKMIYVYS